MMETASSPLTLVLAAGIALPGAAVIVTTLLPLIRRSSWWIRIWDFPRAQNAIVGPVLVVAGLMVLPLGFVTTLFLAALAAVSVYQMWRVFPFTPLAPRQMLDATRNDEARRLRILVTNVEVFNRNAQPVIEAVRSAAPDLWLALETDAFWGDSLRPLDELFADGVDRLQENPYGLFFRSRLPLRDVAIRELIEPGIPSLHARVRLRCGDWISFRGLHPRPPHTFQASGGRDSELMIVAREIAAADEAVIVAGDFNDVPWSRPCRTFQKVARVLDPRLGRGLFNTFNARSRISRWPVDHVFASEHFRFVRLETLPPVGSDHHPLLVELCYEPETAGEQAPRAMQPGDHSAAEALLRRGDGIG